MTLWLRLTPFSCGTLPNLYEYPSWEEHHSFSLYFVPPSTTTPLPTASYRLDSPRGVADTLHSWNLPNPNPSIVLPIPRNLTIKHNPGKTLRLSFTFRRTYLSPTFVLLAGPNSDIRSAPTVPGSWVPVTIKIVEVDSLRDVYRDRSVGDTSRDIKIRVHCLRLRSLSVLSRHCVPPVYWSLSTESLSCFRSDWGLGVPRENPMLVPSLETPHPCQGSRPCPTPVFHVTSRTFIFTNKMVTLLKSLLQGFVILLKYIRIYWCNRVPTKDPHTPVSVQVIVFSYLDIQIYMDTLTLTKLTPISHTKPSHLWVYITIFSRFIDGRYLFVV